MNEKIFMKIKHYLKRSNIDELIGAKRMVLALLSAGVIDYEIYDSASEYIDYKIDTMLDDMSKQDF